MRRVPVLAVLLAVAGAAATLCIAVQPPTSPAAGTPAA
jgi:hypothetical protein